MPRRHELSEKQWRKIRKHLPPQSKTGRPRADDRKTLNGILYVLRTGCQWHFMPEYYGSYKTCHRRLKQWQEQGHWEKLFQHLLGELDSHAKLDLTVTYLDASKKLAKKGDPWLVRLSG